MAGNPITPGALNELRYLNRGGSSIHPMYQRELTRRRLVENIEYITGNGVSVGCDYPLADLTEAGRELAQKASPSND